MKTLSDLFIHELKDLHSAADYMHRILNRMSSSASNPELVKMLDTYYSQVEYQKEKLEELFSTHSIDISSADSPIMSKIKDHGLEAIRYKGSKEVRDLALLLTLNIMKHFEITAFGTILTHAHRMEWEESADLLQSLKKKIAEDEQLPAEIASRILKEGSAELKKEVKALLEKIVNAHLTDENTLLKFLPKLSEHVNSSRLREALETYQLIHQKNREILSEFRQAAQVKEEENAWSVMDGYTSEWKEHLSSGGNKPLKDIGIILSIQRVQHLNMALYEFEHLLSGFIGNSEMEQNFQQLFEQEEGNDQSFSAIAEGSIFREGLDTEVQP